MKKMSEPVGELPGRHLETVLRTKWGGRVEEIKAPISSNI